MGMFGGMGGMSMGGMMSPMSPGGMGMLGESSCSFIDFFFCAETSFDFLLARRREGKDGREDGMLLTTPFFLPSCPS
jgi:hypothetical protein